MMGIFKPNNRARQLFMIGVVAFMGALSWTCVFAGSGGGFDLSWHRIAGGGETFSIGAGFSLGGTIGQHEAGEMSGGSFTLAGGFWAGSAGAHADPTPPCPADLTGSGSVGVADLLELLSQWGACPDGGACPGDLTGSGNVGVTDLLDLLSQWGPCP